ncbi:SIR2 family protein [Nannocystis radixulma]|uniref:SIR2 family protein n=1 Tax=Nannocystis radixulma TaxID=2995305 RepID=A0ABT5B8L7_9BACT|nr:SIR2 family protein [Nannocystis radixulma]MDC0669803.1 SIR2 family protein [Nannocystis radixulma]
MSPEASLPEPAPELVKSLKSRDVVGIVGSGLSCAAGLPGWIELIRAICDEAWDTHPNERKDIAWAWQICEGQPLQAANLLKQDVLAGDFAGAVARQLLQRRRFEVLPELLAQAVEERTAARPWRVTEGPRAVEPWPTASHRMFMQLGLRAVVTTNYDNLLEAAAGDVKVYSWSSSDVADLLAARKPLVLKIHGDLDHPNDIIAARADYVGEFRHSATRRAVASLLQSNRLLWIGYGHNDPDLDLVLDDMRELGIRGGYAIVAELTPPLRRRLKDVAVSVAELPRHADVPRFLQRLALAAERPVAFTVQYSSPANERAAKRRSVELDDLLDSYGVKVNVWGARVHSRELQLEAPAPDFRGLRSLLQAGDRGLFGKLAALGVEACDAVPIVAPPPAVMSIPPAAQPVPASPEVSAGAVATAPDLTAPAPIYVPSGSPAVALAGMLARLFTRDGLAAWLHGFAGQCHHDEDFFGELAVVCSRVAERLGRYDLVTPQLLQSLRDARPDRGHELDALARHILAAPTAPQGAESYSLFCRLLDRDGAWNSLTRACDGKEGPLLFLLHGTPSQHIALFMDRAQRFLDDEASDGVRREHQVCEVMFERDHVRLQTAEEWEETFRRAMGFAKGRPLAEYLQRALAQHAVMFLVRGKNTAPLVGLTPDERDALVEFFRERLTAVLATLRSPHRAVRVLLAVEHPQLDTGADELFNAVDEGLRAVTGAERKVLELHFPTASEVRESLEKFLSDRGQALTPALRARCDAVYARHQALGDAKNYRDLADDLYRELSLSLA